MPQNRERWIQACKDTRKLIYEQKEKDWQEYIETIDRTSDSRKIWNTIRAMDGRKTTQNNNEVLEVDGVCYVSDKDKANQFAKTYKSFSRLPAWKEDRKLRNNNRRNFKARTTQQEGEGPITVEEMLRAISNTKFNKAAGEDEIPYEFIRNLGPKAQEYLLHLYQRIWEGEGIPTRWRRQLIKPFVKEGKDPKATVSYRPISLTACLGKIMESRQIDFHLRNETTPQRQSGWLPSREMHNRSGIETCVRSISWPS